MMRGTKDIGVIRQVPTATRGRGRGGKPMSSVQGGGEESGDGTINTPSHDMSREQTTDYPQERHHHHSALPGGAPQPGHPHYHGEPTSEVSTANNPYVNARFRGSPAPQGGVPQGTGPYGGDGGYNYPPHHNSQYHTPSNAEADYTRPYQPHSHHQSFQAGSGGYQHPNASYYNSAPNSGGGSREHSQHNNYNNNNYYQNPESKAPHHSAQRPTSTYPHHSQHAPHQQHNFGYPTNSGPPPFTTNFSQRGGEGAGSYYDSRNRNPQQPIHHHHHHQNHQPYQPHSSAQHHRQGGGYAGPQQPHMSHPPQLNPHALGAFPSSTSSPHPQQQLQQQERPKFERETSQPVQPPTPTQTPPSAAVPQLNKQPVTQSKADPKETSQGSKRPTKEPKEKSQSSVAPPAAADLQKPASSKPPPVPIQTPPQAASPLVPPAGVPSATVAVSRPHPQPIINPMLRLYQDSSYQMLAPLCPRDFDFNSNDAYAAFQAQLPPNGNPDRNKAHRLCVLQEPCYWRVVPTEYNGSYASDTQISITKSVRISSIHSDPSSNMTSFLTSVSPRVRAKIADAASLKKQGIKRTTVYNGEPEFDLKSMWSTFDVPEGIAFPPEAVKYKYTCTLSGMNLEYANDSPSLANANSQAVEHRRLLYKVLSCVGPSVDAHLRQQRAEADSQITLSYFQRSIAEEIAEVLFGGSEPTSFVPSAKGAEDTFSSILPGWKTDAHSPADTLSQPLHPLHTAVVAELRQRMSKSDESAKAPLLKELHHLRYYLPYYPLQTASAWHAFVTKVKAIFSKPLPQGEDNVDKLLLGRAYEILAAMRVAQADEVNPVLINHRQRIEAALQVRVFGQGRTQDVATLEKEFLAARRSISGITWFNSLRPHDRAPLHETVDLLSHYMYPALTSASNSDFTFSSWFSVLWKPQYDGVISRKNTPGSFLTYYAVRPARHLFRPKASPLSLSMRFFTDAEREILTSCAAKIAKHVDHDHIRQLANRLQSVTDLETLARIVHDLTKSEKLDEYLKPVKAILTKDVDHDNITHGPFISDRFAWDNGTPECAVFRCDSRIFAGSIFAKKPEPNDAANDSTAPPTTAYEPPLSLWESGKSQDTLAEWVNAVSGEPTVAKATERSISVPVVGCIPIKVSFSHWTSPRERMDALVSTNRGEANLAALFKSCTRPVRQLCPANAANGQAFEWSREVTERILDNSLPIFPLYLIATAAEIMAQSSPSFANAIVANVGLQSVSAASAAESVDVARIVLSGLTGLNTEAADEPLQMDYQAICGQKVLIESSMSRAEVLQGTLNSGRQLEDFNRVITSDAATKLFMDNVLSGVFGAHFDAEGTVVPTPTNCTQFKVYLWSPPNKMPGRKDGLEDMI